MKKFNRVAIIGVGLIGGSIGLAVRKHHLAKEVVGVCRTSRSIRLAKKIGAIDWGTVRLSEALRGADLVILATPISAMHPLARQIALHLKPGSLVIDVASTKQKVIRDLEEIFPPGILFVGSHPLAGREKTSASFATADLFRKAPCFVVPTRRSDPKSIQTICLFWKALGGKVIRVKAEQHDEIVSKVSHLPHIAAALLVLEAGRTPWVGNGFLDMTRIASSEASLWRDILFSNRLQMLKTLRRFRRRLDGMVILLEKKDRQAVLRRLQKAKRLREWRVVR